VAGGLHYYLNLLFKKYVFFVVLKIKMVRMDKHLNSDSCALSNVSSDGEMEGEDADVLNVSLEEGEIEKEEEMSNVSPEVTEVEVEEEGSMMSNVSSENEIEEVDNDDVEVIDDEVDEEDEESSSKEEIALKIIDFIQPADESLPPQISLVKENLQWILDLAGNRKLSIISIVGEPSVGKSFFLNFILRYLEAQEDAKVDWLDYKNKSRVLTGFEWKFPTPRGIFMWSRPFVLMKGSEEVAVLLVDTPGVSNCSGDAAILGLTSLISSCLILNTPSNLQEVNGMLSALPTYCTRELLENNAAGIPVANPSLPTLQRLYFLIRDWTNTSTFPLKAAGGQEFLESDFFPTKLLENSPLGNYEQVDCFLMAPIGEEALLPKFNGCNSQLSDNFIESLEESVEHIAHPGEIRLKHIFGNDISAPDLSDLIEQWITLFDKQTTPPSVEDLFFVTARISNQILIKESRKKYVDGMRKRRWIEEFDQAHNECLQDAQDHFKRAKIDCLPSDMNSIEVQLQSEMSSEIDCLKIEKELVDEYKTDISEKLAKAKSGMFESEFDEISTPLKFSLLTKFKEKLATHYSWKAESSALLIEALDNVQETFRRQNNDKQSMAFRKMLEIMGDVCSEFVQEAEFLMGCFVFESKEDFETWVDGKKQHVHDAFQTGCDEVGVGGSEECAFYFEELDNALDLHLSDNILKYLQRRQEAEKSADELLNVLKSNFAQDLENDLAKNLWERTEVQRRLNQFQEAASCKLLAECHFTKESSKMKLLTEELRSCLESTSEQFLDVWSVKKTEAEQVFQQASQNSLLSYSKEMIICVGTCESKEDLKVEHIRLQDRAAEMFESLTKVERSMFSDYAMEQLDKLKIEINCYFQSSCVPSWKKNQEQRMISKTEDLTKKYEQEMISAMDSTNDLKGFDSLHRNCWTNALSKLQEIYQRNPSPDCALSELIQRLKDEIKPFYERLKLKFKEILAGRDAKSKGNQLVKEIQQKYETVFKKHLESTEDLTSFEDLHKLYEKVAMDEFGRRFFLNEIPYEPLLEQMHNAINTSYASLKETFEKKLVERMKKEQEAEESRLKNVVQDIQTKYILLMMSHLDKLLDEQQLDSKHDELWRAAVGRYQQEAVLTGETNSSLCGQLLDKLRTGVCKSFLDMKKQFQNKLKERNRKQVEETEARAEQGVQSYQDNYKSKFKKQAKKIRDGSELERIHAKLSRSTIDKFHQEYFLQGSCVTKEMQQKWSNKLKCGMEHIFNEAKQRRVQREESRKEWNVRELYKKNMEELIKLQKTEEQAVSDVKKYCRGYRSTMESKMNSVRYESELEIMHTDIQHEMLRDFLKYNKDCEEKFRVELEKTIAETYEEIKGTFLHKLEEQRKALEPKVVPVAQRFFCEEQLQQDADGLVASSTFTAAPTDASSLGPSESKDPKEKKTEEDSSSSKTELRHHKFRKYRQWRGIDQKEHVEVEEGELSESQSGQD
jgi:hypothetical protein